MGIASLVLGIVGLLCSVYGSTSYVAVCLGIPGIVLGAIGTKKGLKCSVAGLVLSILAVIVGGIVAIACLACATAASIF